jgi:hypothetical protein
MANSWQGEFPWQNLKLDGFEGTSPDHWPTSEDDQAGSRGEAPSNASLYVEMEPGYALKETLQVELPDLAGAARLATVLRPHWPVHVHERNDVVLVTAYFRTTTSDLAWLLRSVETWVARESLCAIRYELDGRDYVMEAGEADWTFAPSAEAA